MKQLFTLIALVAATGMAFAQASAPAAGASKPLSAQNQKMSDCAKANKGKKGADYKQGMSSCMSGEAPAPAASVSQKQKMSDCAKANKGKKGDDYKSAMQACLKA